MPHSVRDLTPYIKDKEIVYRFLEKVAFCDHGKACKLCHWLWKGARNNTGYGSFYICYLSLYPQRRLIVTAHRFMWTIEKGHTNISVLHACDIRACCNIHHLFEGTYSDNTQDMIKKGRGNYSNAVKGEKHHRAKITSEVIPHIFRLKDSGITQKEIGLIVGLSQAQVGRILNGKRWQHLQNER